jgi:hypothetical protein
VKKTTLWVQALVGFMVCVSPRGATGHGAQPVYAIAIGNNEVPIAVRREGTEDPVTLRYADDDAASFYSFISQLTSRAFLLTVLDADSQRRFPELVSEAHPPTAAEMDLAVEAIRRAMVVDRAMGREPVLLFFYSGHGVRNADGAAALALRDSTLNQQQLYDRLLAKLPAKFVHVIVDACHAEAVVRPRDADAVVEPLAPNEEHKYLQDWTLARFPHVGAILASTSGTQSFEWEPYHGGVFAHEVLSGLRGGADVNSDGRIEYSELAAFLAAANQRISDPAVRPAVVVQAPQSDGRAAIVDLTDLRGHFHLKGRASGAWAAPFFLETEAGLRLADVHAEIGSKIDLRLPVGGGLHVVRSDGEAVVATSDSGDARLESLVVRRQVVARDFETSAMRSGLFATAFGVGFYEGYISQKVELIPVPYPPAQAPAADLDLRPAPARRDVSGLRKTVGRTFLVGAALSAAVAGVATGFMLYARHQYQSTSVERTATEARDRFETDGMAAGIAGGASAALGIVGALLYWLPGSEPIVAPATNGTASDGRGLGVVGRL